MLSTPIPLTWIELFELFALSALLFIVIVPEYSSTLVGRNWTWKLNDVFGSIVLLWGFKIENALFDDLDYKRPNSLLNPSEPFPHQEPWNLEFKPTVSEKNKEEYEKQYFEFSKDLMNGVIAICNYGCGISLNLVVNGEEYGNIWSDHRGNDGGICPSFELENKGKITFLNWYELWLDNSFNEISANTAGNKV